MYESALEFLGGAEEQRSVDAVDQNAGAARAGNGRTGIAVITGMFHLLFHTDGVRHAPHEKKRREDHPHIDRHHQIDEHREKERQQQDAHIDFGRPPDDAYHVRQFAHVPGDHE